MTREEYEKQQSVVRRVFDPDTGRHRLASLVPSPSHTEFCSCRVESSVFVATERFYMHLQVGER